MIRFIHSFVHSLIPGPAPYLYFFAEQKFYKYLSTVIKIYTEETDT